MIVDLHCDTISKIRELRAEGNVQGNLKENPLQLDLMRMETAGYILQNFAIYMDSDQEASIETAYSEMYDIYREEIQELSDFIAPIKNYQDILVNQRSGRISAMLTLEEGAVVSTHQRLSELYQDGVRLITLTWNHKNNIGCPNCIRPDGSLSLTIPNTEVGLTPYGFELISQMEELHMMIDVSHLSDRGFYDVYENTKTPFLASHSNARAITPHVRNLTDDMIRKIAERGGIIGINFERSFLGEEGDNGIAAVLRHLEHIARIGGTECIALGSDFDGIEENPELRGAQDMEKLENALKKNGWNQTLVEKLFYKNALHYYREVLRS